MTARLTYRQPVDDGLFGRIAGGASAARLAGMCRSIKTLRGPERASDEEIEAAALQFVRKISGYRQPSRANREVFDKAVRDVADAARDLLDDLVTPARAG